MASADSTIPGAADRKLKADGSNAESPEKKITKTGDGDDITPGWAKQLMAKIDGMDGKMDGMTAKVDDAVKLAHEAKDQVKLVEVKLTSFRVEIDSMRKELNDNHKEKDERNQWQRQTDERLKDEIDKRIADIGKKFVVKQPLMDDRALTMVVGGVGLEGDEDTAKQWVIEQIQSIQVEPPKESDIYFKGDKYKGMLFCRFGKPETTDQVIRELIKSKLEFRANNAVFQLKVQTRRTHRGKSPSQLPPRTSMAAW